LPDESAIQPVAAPAVLFLDFASLANCSVDQTSGAFEISAFADHAISPVLCLDMRADSNFRT
jgi:hypothetical protein